VVFCAAIASLQIAAQPAAHLTGTDFQSWNELDILTRLLPDLDVTWIARVRLSEELPNTAHYVFGTDWNFSVGKNLVLTPSYYAGTVLDGLACGPPDHLECHPRRRGDRV